MDILDGLKAFVATAQSGSFTEAAERLGISNRLTSKYVAELESRIGARLLQRTTRKVGLTPTGQDLLNRAPALLDEIDEMLGSISEVSQGLSGMIRIAASVSFGEMYLNKMLARFCESYPEISIDLRLDDAHIDLAESGFDLAFRIGKLEHSALKVRKLGEIGSLIVASPEYLEAKGVPEKPEDLEHHPCIVDSNRRDYGRWTFQHGESQVSIAPVRRYLVNSPRVARDWALEGLGVALCPDFVLHDALETGKLVALLDGYHLVRHPVSAVYLEGRVLPKKVRTLIDFAVEDMKQMLP